MPQTQGLVLVTLGMPSHTGTTALNPTVPPTAIDDMGKLTDRNRLASHTQSLCDRRDKRARNAKSLQRLLRYIMPRLDFSQWCHAMSQCKNIFALRLVTIPTTTTGTASSQAFGLDWSGDEAVRRMFCWHNPFAIDDATYIFEAYPHKKMHGCCRYYTTCFWGNGGTYVWDNGSANAYYGDQPYPIPAPIGPGQFGISVKSNNDFMTDSEVQWNRWYTQTFCAWRESPPITHHEFYWDWPDSSKEVISQTVNDPVGTDQNPPTPPDRNEASTRSERSNVGGIF